MRKLALTLALTLALRSFGAACCLGGGPKSFIALSRLEKYEVGLASGLRSVYGQYDVYGDVVPAPKNQTATLSFGAGFRLTEDLQITSLVPMVSQQYRLESVTNLGDVFVGAQYMLLESLFQSDWYPTVAIQGGVKTPTGIVESSSLTGDIKGTGNGLWEPNIGILIQKSYLPFNASLRAAYTPRFVGRPITEHEGDLFELSESLGLTLTQRWSINAGLNQAWTRAGSIKDDSGNWSVAADSQTRIISGFASTTYFLNRFWSVNLSAESVIPIEKWGVNQQAFRSITMTTKYGWF